MFSGETDYPGHAPLSPMSLLDCHSQVSFRHSCAVQVNGRKIELFGPPARKWVDDHRNCGATDEGKAVLTVLEDTVHVSAIISI